MENNQKYALITGATSGIGYELAKLFAQDKYNLVNVARSEEELRTREAEFTNYGIEVVSIAKDLSDRNQAMELCEEVRMRGIRIDVLVNDAGQGLYGEFKDTDLERELAIIDLNISATIILTKHFLQEMTARNDGKILNLASIASKLPGPLQSVYHATKAFVLSFSEALHSELAETNVTVTALMPGVTDTDFFRKAEMLDSKAVQDKDAMADPAEVAKDGYEALMAGQDKVISGFKNKAQVAMSNMMPDSTVADMLKKQQEPVQHH
ncbi:MAG: SDR family oxidoreductase [Bacteroidetes bacterium]|nr:SDR family oxidoreductase [Bacteroidota bacterium]